MLSRRTFVIGTGVAGAMLALRGLLGATGKVQPADVMPFGPLQADSHRILDLPPGFSYRIIARSGDRMSDGLLTPGAPDGMAAFANGAERVTLVRNHELNFDQHELSPFGKDSARLSRGIRDKLYDAGGEAISLGGTTTLIYNLRTQQVERQFLSLAGTERNCAGGLTPWSSWLSCEESVTRADGIRARDHGWVFEVPATATGLVDPVPLTALGRFNHEAAVVDPRTGIVYLTEDRIDSLIYRLLPEPPGRARAGRLQALALNAWHAADTRNWSRRTDTLPAGEAFSTRWIDLEDTDAPEDDLRLRGHARGAAIFARGEGMWFGRDEFYFTCTTGGPLRAGQIFRYRPGRYEGDRREQEAPGQLELLVESDEPRRLNNCDNVTVTPWGDVLVCEDAGRGCGLVGITPAGGLYRFAHNAYTGSELSGACFAPDGHPLFVNIQEQSLTLAISGPFPVR